MENFIKETIVKAGEAILSHFGAAKITHSKATVNDIVTEADLASQKILVEAIKVNYPDHGIVSEESEGYQAGADYVWYIDPLDGTKNFESGVQIFGVNVAVTYMGKLKYAAIYLPALQELCYAEEGKGAFLNDKKITCSDKKDWSGIYGIGATKYSEQNVEFQKVLSELSGNTAWLNAIGSIAVSGVWVATGRRNFFLSKGGSSWDYAAPALLAKEAGCLVTNFNGEEWKPGDTRLVISNKHLHPKLLETVQSIYL